MRGKTKLLSVGAAAMLSLAGLGACSSDATGVRGSEVRAARYSGETAFAGIFFGQGAAGARLTGIWQGKTLDQQVRGVKAADMLLARERLVASIRKQDPTFFDRFGAAVQSGSHLQVDAAMNEAFAMAKAAAPGDIRTMEEEAAGLHLYRAVEFYEYVAVYRYAVLFEAAFWATEAETASAAMYTGETSELGREMVVDEITRKLGA